MARGKLGQLPRVTRLRVRDEKVVLERVERRDAARGVEAEHFLEQRRGPRSPPLDVPRGQKLPQLVSLVLPGFQVGEVRELGDPWEGLFRGGSQHPADLVDLRPLFRAGEERLSQQQLGADASHRPHVDLGAVARRAKQQLGRAVPERDDSVGEGPALLLRRRRGVGGRRGGGTGAARSASASASASTTTTAGLLAVGPRQPKVGELELALVVDQQIRGLQVSVQHAARVAVVEPSEELLHVALGVRRREGVAPLFFVGKEEKVKEDVGKEEKKISEKKESGVFVRRREKEKK